jgi:sialate O-acetylesterase
MRRTIGCIFLLTASGLWADVRLGNVFTANMVLQREQKVPVWGTADPGEAVTIEFAGQKVSAKADRVGKWGGTLAPMPASTIGRTMTVTSSIGDHQLAIGNILVGDVWLCAGQSNMAFMLEKDRRGETEVSQSGNPMIRMLLTAWQSSDTPLEAVKRRDPWLESSPEVSRRCTAVGYWFAKEIQKSTGVPVGLVTAYKGGSPVEAWLPRQALLASSGGREVWDRYEEALKVFPAKHAVYLEEMKAWREEVKGLTFEERNKVKRPRMPYGPLDGNHPCGLYYGSIVPYLPMAIKGVLWYQAESNGCSPMRKAVNYESTFTNLIRAWRQAWRREDLPFLFVQLPPFRAMSPEPEDSVWSRVRDAQTRTLALPHTGMAIITDAGNERDIHPKDKKTVGDRLARWAKASVYGMDLVPSGPLFDKVDFRDGKAVVTFRHVGKGLETRDVRLIGGHELSREKLRGFSICGEDEVFAWADAKVTGRDEVTVFSPDVSTPVAVRYGWSSFPLCNLYNCEGLPASPFRTDAFVPVSLRGGK